MSAYAPILRKRSFLTLLGAGALTYAAPSVAIIIVNWSVVSSFSRTVSGLGSSALAISLLGLAAGIPTLAAAFFSGALADRMNRRTLMRQVNLLSIGCAVGLVLVLLLHPSASIPIAGSPSVHFPLFVLLVYPLWAVFYVSATLFRPAFNASVPKVLAPGELGAGNGLILTVSVLVSVIGSLAAGVLLEFVAPGLVMIVPVALYVVAQGFLIALTTDLRPRRQGITPPFLEDVMSGFRYLARRRELLTITLSGLAINFLTSLAFVMFSLYVYAYLQAGAIFFGALVAASTGGVAIGSLIAGKIRFEPRSGLALCLLALLLGGAVLLLGFTRSLYVALPVVIGYGTVIGLFTTIFLAVIQATVPEELLGRVLAADEVGSLALIPAGQWAGGLTTLVYGVAFTFRISGALATAVGALMAAVPALRRFGFEPRGRGTPPTRPASGGQREASVSKG